MYGPSGFFIVVALTQALYHVALDVACVLIAVHVAKSLRKFVEK